MSSEDVEHRRAEHLAAHLQDSAEDLYEDAPCGYLSTLPDGTLALVNRTFLTWTGFERDDLVGVRRFADLLSAGGRIYHETHVTPLLRMQGSVRSIALDLVRADGSVLPVLVHARARTDGDGRVLAVRITVFDATDRKGYERELLTARRRAEAYAAERDRAYGEARSVAQTLQRSMLPRELPADVRLTLASAYRAAVDGLDVGGDWYDAFLLDADRIALVVGDVVGRGLHAAAAMGQLRSAVRAIAVSGSGPAEVLDNLDRFVAGVEAADTATLVYGELDLRTGRLRYACAGHPPPVLIAADGAAELLWGGRSTPLGAHFGAARRGEAEATLLPGSRLVLYTDGLVERRDAALDDRLDDLAAALRGLAPAALADLVDGVVGAMLGHGPTGDDVCVLALGLRGSAGGG